MSIWSKWKEKNLEAQEAGVVTPTAMLNPDSPKVTLDVQANRLALCERCPFFTGTHQCSRCGCFMPFKTQLLHAKCPEGIW
jgi:hypothetical protein